MSTRQAFSPQLYLNALGDRPWLSVDCGFKKFVFHFDDCEDLDGLLSSAVLYRGMPEYAAANALEYTLTCFGHYDDDSFGDPAEAGVSTEAIAPGPAFSTTPPGRHAGWELFWAGVLIGVMSWMAWSVFQ